MRKRGAVSEGGFTLQGARGDRQISRRLWEGPEWWGGRLRQKSEEGATQ